MNHKMIPKLWFWADIIDPPHNSLSFHNTNTAGGSRASRLCQRRWANWAHDSDVLQSGGSSDSDHHCGDANGDLHFCEMSEVVKSKKILNW